MAGGGDKKNSVVEFQSPFSYFLTVAVIMEFSLKLNETE